MKEQLLEDYDKWVLELFDTIEQRLGSLVHEFHKYPKALDTQHELKIFSRTFIGSFSEYLVYLLLERINARKLQLTPCSEKEYLNDLLFEINNVLQSNCEIRFRYRTSQNHKHPDIDIAIISDKQNIIGVSVKNGHLRGDFRDIKKEFYVAKELGFRCFVVLINFLKNMDLAPEIFDFIHQLKTLGLIIYFVDLKDFVECLIDNIQKQDKEFSLHIPKNELLYTLDY